MMKEEFERKAGVEIKMLEWRVIENAYMTRDDLFPTQESVVDCFKKHGMSMFFESSLEDSDRVKALFDSIAQKWGGTERAQLIFGMTLSHI